MITTHPKGYRAQCRPGYIPDPLPYKITTHPSGYRALCRPGYTPDPRRCSQWFSRTAECPAPSWVGWPVQLARGCQGIV